MLVINMALTQLKKNADKKFICPTCGDVMRKSDGDTLKVKDGKVDMNSALPRYICDNCGVFYRELLHSGYYDVFDLPAEEKKAKPKIISTADIPPTQLKREADGKCPCPRCGERMDFVEAGPVQIVNGKPDFSNTMDHVNCPNCKSVFRKIVGTDYFQWSDK